MRTAQELLVQLLSARIPQESALGAAGQLIHLCPFPGAQRPLLPYAGPAVAWGDNISDPAFAPWLTVAGTPGFTLPNRASGASKLRDDISHFLFSPHKVINERISAVNSLGCCIIYLYIFTIHLSIT